MIEVHATLPRSRTNGPGLRYVLWLQGCTLGCPGCFNPLTHPSPGGRAREIGELVSEICSLVPEIEGVSISGGEPFQQPDGLFELVSAIRQYTRLSLLVFSGFTYEEICRIPAGPRVLDKIDVLVAGRYVASARHGRALLGSANQSVHFLTDRYGPRDLKAVPETEVYIGADGEIVMSGIGGPAVRI